VGNKDEVVRVFLTMKCYPTSINLNANNPCHLIPRNSGHLGTYQQNSNVHLSQKIILHNQYITHYSITRTMASLRSNMSCVLRPHLDRMNVDRQSAYSNQKFTVIVRRSPCSFAAATWCWSTITAKVNTLWSWCCRHPGIILW